MKVRKSSRAILLDSEDRIFLFKFEFAMLSEHNTLWVTPGGGVEDGENFEQALSREIYEELGFEIKGDFKWLYYRNKPFTTKSGQTFISEERYYLIKVDNFNINFENMTYNEQNHTKDWKWWTIEEIMGFSETFFADNLGERLTEVINGSIPDKPLEI